MSSKMMGAVNEGEMKRIEAILLSMTPAERKNPRIIDGNRRRRIAKGSGTHVSDVARLLQDFKKMKKMMRGMKGRRRLQGLGLPMG
jgi:signal recognition particle subunit SRP54